MAFLSGPCLVMTPVALVRDEFRICLDEGHRCIMMQYHSRGSRFCRRREIAARGDQFEHNCFRKISAGLLESDSLGMVSR